MRCRFRLKSWAVWTVVASLALTGNARADLRFDDTAVKLGEIRAGVPLACQFAFVNDGSGTVELIEARPGCGCLLPRLAQRVFAAGQGGTIPLEIHTLGQAAGPHTWQLTLAYRDGDQVREKVLSVTATVVVEVSVQPASLTLFAAGALTHELTVTDLRKQPLTIVRVDSTAPWLHAQATPMAQNSLGYFTAKVKLDVSADCPPGRHAEFVVLYTNDQQYPELKVAVTVVRRDRTEKY